MKAGGAGRKASGIMALHGIMATPAGRGVNPGRAEAGEVGR